MTEKKARKLPVAKMLEVTPPLAVPNVEQADIAAIKAVYRGDAKPEMQRRAMDFIMKKICLVGDLAWSENSESASSFKAGRRFPALFIVQCLQTNSTPFDKPN